MSPASAPPQSHHRFPVQQAEAFQAALEAVRSMPGWEVVTAHPEIGEITARSRGRLFTPSMDHMLRFIGHDDGTEVEMEHRGIRHDPSRVDPKTIQMFQTLLEDRLVRGTFGPHQTR